MKQRILIVWLVVSGFLVSAGLVWAATEKVIFDLPTLTNAESAGLWQIFNNSDEGLYQRDGGLLLKSDGDAYLVYSNSFSYHDYDRIRLVLTSDQPLRLAIIPNVSTTGYNTYELRQRIPASIEEPLEITVSLRLPFFKEPINDLGINFYSTKPAEITIQEIRLEKMNFGELLGSATQDYWRVFEYSPFTVNLFAAPRIMGRSATVYFLPIIIIAIWLLAHSKRWRKGALLVLLAGWLLIDGRMMYEFISYHVADYQDYVKPPVAQKTFRGYGEFYQFADWANQRLTKGEEVNFYKFGSSDFPRIMQYLVYPSLINDETQQAGTYLIYNRSDISYHEDDGSLYLNQERLSQPGKILGIYNDNSFIFREQ